MKRDISTNSAALNEKPYRNMVEVLLYLSIGTRLFGNEFGVLSVVGLSGAIILASGFISFVILIARQEPLPKSVMFAVLISLLATIVDLHLVDLVPRNMLFWTSILLMTCYVVRDESGHLRCTLFLAACVFLSVFIGGTFFSGMNGVQRLGLESGKVASMFGNPNDLAQISLITAVALLFLGFRFNRLISVFCTIVALGLISVVLLTLSRQGLILLTGSLCLYLMVALFSRTRKLDTILLMLTAVGLIIVFRTEVMNIADGYLFRMGLESSRVEYWKTAPHDLTATLMAGYGTQNAYTLEGLQPHSAFLWLHLAYGGFCAIVYTAWILWLATRTKSLVFDHNLPGILRTEGLVMFFIFFALQFTSVFSPYNYGCILAVATLEKNFAKKVLNV